jgi:hypothetical protein
MFVPPGMDWARLEALIRDERKAGNPVAGLIAPQGLHLADNAIRWVFGARHALMARVWEWQTERKTESPTLITKRVEGGAHQRGMCGIHV